jgi:hypothetical protein
MLVRYESPLCAHQHLEDRQKCPTEAIIVFSDRSPIFDIYVTIIVEFDSSRIKVHANKGKDIHEEAQQDNIRTHLRQCVSN